MGKPYSEESLQKSVAAFLRRAMPDNIRWTAVESSGRGARDGARQKAKGVNQGWADFQFVLPPSGQYLGVELKRPKVPSVKQSRGVQSQLQRDFERDVTCSGAAYSVAYSVSDVEAILRSHGVNLKASAI